MASIIERKARVGPNAGSNTLTITFDSAPANGELIVGFLRQSSPTQVSLPSGFSSTQYHNITNAYFWLVWKTAGPSEGTAYIFNESGVATEKGVVLWRIEGWDSIGTVKTNVVSNHGGSSGESPVADSATAMVVGDIALASAGHLASGTQDFTGDFSPRDESGYRLDAKALEITTAGDINTNWTTTADYTNFVRGILVQINTATGATIADVNTTNTVVDGSTGNEANGESLDDADELRIRKIGSATEAVQTITNQTATKITFSHVRGNIPLTSASHALEAVLYDALAVELTTKSITVSPASGWAVVEMGDNIIANDPETKSLWDGYTGDPPAEGDQILYETTTAQGGTLSVDASGVPTIDYPGEGPASDSVDVWYWSGGEWYGPVNVQLSDSVPGTGIRSSLSATMRSRGRRGLASPRRF